MKTMKNENKNNILIINVKYKEIKYSDNEIYKIE